MEKHRPYYQEFSHLIDSFTQSQHLVSQTTKNHNTIGSFLKAVKQFLPILNFRVKKTVGQIKNTLQEVGILCQREDNQRVF